MHDALHGIALLAWLALATAGAWLAPPKWQGTAVLVCGAGLLAWFSPLSLILLTAATLASYAAPRLKRGRSLAIRGVILLTAAGYVLLLWQSHESWSQTNLAAAALPLGMAYYVLRIVHYLLEMDRGGFRQHHLGDYAKYQFLPPVLFVGPIHRFDEFLRDLRRRRWDADDFSTGAGRVLFGLVQIVVIGGVLIGMKVEPKIAQLHLSGLTGVYTDALLYWAKLYVLFSGYTDVAIGFALMMGFRVRENFNRPYLAHNIGDFWRRWHMSLSSWCRDYVYMPVLARARNHTVAAAASMIVLGLWHSLSLHYLLWGLYHGVGLAVWRAFSLRTTPVFERLSTGGRFAWTSAARLVTLHFVIFSFSVTTVIEHRLLGS
ncbi:MAG: MBOAT family O-acyltransferase [Caulobacteraceae bacterium]